MVARLSHRYSRRTSSVGSDVGLTWELMRRCVRVNLGSVNKRVRFRCCTNSQNFDNSFRLLAGTYFDVKAYLTLRVTLLVTVTKQGVSKGYPTNGCCNHYNANFRRNTLVRACHYLCSWVRCCFSASRGRVAHFPAWHVLGHLVVSTSTRREDLFRSIRQVGFPCDRTFATGTCVVETSRNFRRQRLRLSKAGCIDSKPLSPWAIGWDAAKLCWPPAWGEPTQ